VVLLSVPAPQYSPSVKVKPSRALMVSLPASP